MAPKIRREKKKEKKKGVEEKRGKALERFFFDATTIEKKTRNFPREKLLSTGHTYVYVYIYIRTVDIGRRVLVRVSTDRNPVPRLASSEEAIA